MSEGITQHMRDFFAAFPKSTAKECCRVLDVPYKKYGQMARNVKSQMKKWCQTIVKPKRSTIPYVSAHRVEWEIERGVPVEQLLKLRVTAEKCRPRLEDPRPVGTWYVIPNRNRQLEFHDEFVSIRVFPGTGTCRIQPSKEMDYKELGDRVWEAFLSGGLFSKECDDLLLHLEVGPKHKTFRVGPVTPFKIDYYKDSVGLVFQADGTHPNHIEGIESWPSWPKALIQSNYEQTEAITLLTEQMRLHLSVLAGINENFKLNVGATQDLKTATAALAKVLGIKVKERKKAPKRLMEFGQRALTDYK